MSGDVTSILAGRMFEYVRNVAAFGPREDASQADGKVAEYIASVLTEAGLDVQRQSIPAWVTEPIKTSLQILGPSQLELECRQGTLSGVTGTAGVTGELAYVNKGFPSDLVGKDLAGKIAIAWQERYWEGGDQPREKVRRAAEMGAVGFIFAMKRRDGLITCWGLGSTPAPIPFVSVSYPDFLALGERIQSGPVRATLRVLGQPRQTQSYNVWAVVRGTVLPDEVIGVGSGHHDTVPWNPGANDNASGQAVLLELARFFQAHPQKRTILLLSNGGEETGLWGASGFIEANREWLSKSLKAMVVMDQIGTAEPLVYAGTTEWLEKAWIDEAEKLGYRLVHCHDQAIIGYHGAHGDATPFYDAGFPTAFCCAWPTDWFYHTTEDTLDKVSANVLKGVADSTAALLMRLASR